MDGRHKGNIRNIIRTAETETSRVDTGKATKILRQAIEVATLKGHDISELLSDCGFDGKIMSTSSFSGFLKRLGQFSPMTEDDRLQIINIARADTSEDAIPLHIIEIVIGQKYSGSVRLRLAEYLLKHIQKFQSFLSRKLTAGFSYDDDISYAAMDDILSDAINLFSSFSREQLRQIYGKIDIDACGKLSLTSLLQYLKLRDSFSAIHLDAESLLNLLLSRVQERGIDIDKVFRHFDSNGDGLISGVELTSGLEKLKIFEGLDGWRDEMPAISAKFDTSGDGMVSLSEFYKYIGVQDYTPNIIQRLTKIFAVAQGKGLSINDIFAEFDKDSSGQLSASEIFDGLKRIGTFSEVSISDIHGLVQQFDRDGSGEVSSKEFVDFFSERVALSIHERTLHHQQMLANRFRKFMIAAQEKGLSIGQIFDHFDADRSGSVTTPELAAGLRKLPHLSKLTQEDISALIAIIDSDGNGTVSKEEFVEFVTQKSSRRVAKVIETPVQVEIKDTPVIRTAERSNEVFGFEESYEFSTDPELHNIERKLRHVGTVAVSRGLDIEAAFISCDRQGAGLVPRSDFIDILVKMGASLADMKSEDLNGHSRIREDQISQIRKIKGSSVVSSQLNLVTGYRRNYSQQVDSGSLRVTYYSPITHLLIVLIGSLGSY